MGKYTKEKQEQWNKLYEYIKKILGYDENQALNKTMILRLRGMREGKTIANNKTKSTANYSFEVVLNAFMVNISGIQYALSHKDFKDETGKFMYICAIAEKSLNDVYSRMKKVESESQKIESVNINTEKGADYIPRSKNIDNDKLNNLW